MAAQSPPRQVKTATALAWTYAIQGWRRDDGSSLKPAGQPLREAAQQYLSARVGGWPTSRPWPSDIRELPAAALAKWQRESDRRWPVELRCIGVVLFSFYGSGEPEPEGLQCEAFARGGRRVPHRIAGRNVTRWTLGPTSGRVFHVAPSSGPPTGVAICEGPTTALAIAAERPRALVLAVGDPLASCAAHVRGHLPRRLPVRVYGEQGGHAAARVASRDLRAIGLTTEPPWLPPLDAGPPGFGFACWRVMKHGASRRPWMATARWTARAPAIHRGARPGPIRTTVTPRRLTARAS